MDKLQQALDRARRIRSEQAERQGEAPAQQPAAAPAPAPATARRSPAPAVNRQWDTVPMVRLDEAHLARNRIVTLSACAEANDFDILRTKILLQMQKNGWTRLAITSPGRGCGKSTLACNLAAGLTRQRDLYAMLIELDLRRPVIAKMLGLKPTRDVTAMLTGMVPLKEQALRISENVLVAAAMHPMGDPTSILLNRQTPEVLARIEQEHQPNIMIFDLPPIMQSDDTRAFLTNVDCTLIVARAEETTLGQIDSTEGEIAEHTNVLGVVLNGCHHPDADESKDAYGYSQADA